MTTTIDGQDYSGEISLRSGEQATVSFDHLLSDGFFRSSTGEPLRDAENGSFVVDNGRPFGGLIMHYQIVNPETATCEPGTGEMAYYESVSHEYEQVEPESEEIYVQTWGLMNNSDTRNISGQTEKTVSGSTGLQWFGNGLLVFPDSSGSADLTDTVTLIACASGSFSLFSASTLGVSWTKVPVSDLTTKYKLTSCGGIFNRCVYDLCDPAKAPVVICPRASFSTRLDFIKGITGCRYTVTIGFVFSFKFCTITLTTPISSCLC
ncbi:MAG TPA: hypothetical protein VLU25_00125 [Acidobacteriota bacterium]|nr:hypothetical protein [Acidobacteriota bacterium]